MMQQTFKRLALRLLFLILGFSMLLPVAHSEIEGIDRIIAVVNEDVIMNSELELRMLSVTTQLRQRGTPLPPPDVLRKQVLERMIISKLQIQVAERTGVRISDSTLNQAVNSVARNNGLTLAQFRQTIEEGGFDFGSFREDMRNQMIITRLRQRQVNNRISVSDQEVDNFISVNKKQLEGNKEFRLSHILISVPEASAPEIIQEANQKALDTLQKLRNGANFAEVAASVSDGQNAFEGGDLGWRKSTQLPTIFTEPAKALSKGDISEPIRSPSGFHIIKMSDIRGELKSIITETQARHILIRTNEVTSAELAQIRLSQLRTRIIGGEEFAKLARANSDDRGSAIRGGELGWTKPGQVVPEFEREMQQLQNGEISEPFQTQFGWHIVQVTGKRETDNTEEFTRNKARLAIQKRKGEEETQAWLRRIRDEAYVEYRLQDNL